MHISEGILSGQVLLGGVVLASFGTAVGLKKMDYDRIARAGILAAAFFVASLIHVPIGPASVHLVLNGIVGLLMGWAAFPVILVGLMLQGVIFQFGGITTLGVNTMIMATPALIGHYVFGPLIQKKSVIATAASFSCGAGAILLGTVLVAAALMFTQKDFFKVTLVVAAANFPLMIMEGFITVFCVAFLKKVQPDMLPGSALSE